MKNCLIPAGTFVMGESEADKFANDTERPHHRVTIHRPFLLGAFPVTVAEFRSFRPEHSDCGDPAWPVVSVSWWDAVVFAAWLSRETRQPWRLPTEAEWEYACRAGSKTPFSHGHELSIADANFLYDENGIRIGNGSRSPQGSHPANPFGLEAMHGNVCEWCEDRWHSDFVGAPDDGSAWLDQGVDDRRVIRGGAWDYLPRLLRSSWRDSLPETAARDNVGFRLACDLP